MASDNSTLDLDVSEHDHEAMYSTDDQAQAQARTTWLARRPEVLAEWERRLLGKTFIDTESETDDPKVRLRLIIMSERANVLHQTTVEDLLLHYSHALRTKWIFFYLFVVLHARWSTAQLSDTATTRHCEVS